MQRVLTGLALLPAEDLRQASQPLFETGVVEALEWNLDSGLVAGGIPLWAADLLAQYEQRGALFAHAVELSLLSAELGADQLNLWSDIEKECGKRRYRHLTEHYGFMTAGPYVRGTPLPLPPSQTVRALCVDRFTRLAQASGLPVGIENLGFAFSARDAATQAALINALCEESETFLLLDVHNLLCQAENFDLDPVWLAERYPLARVREIHIAGGQLETRADGSGRFRRDTHDASVPSGALSLLEVLLPRCPALEVVIVERSDRSLFGAREAETFRSDFLHIAELVRGTERSGKARAPEPSHAPAVAGLPEAVDQLDTLAEYQERLLETLLGAEPSAPNFAERLSETARKAYGEAIAGFEPRAFEVARDMVREWSLTAPTNDQMLAAVFREPFVPLSLMGLPIPTPGPHQVLLRARAVGLCGTDAHAFEGRFPVPIPIVLGHELVGEIERLGSAVRGFAEGDRVGVSWVQAGCGSCPNCQKSRPERCAETRTWIHNGGGLSEFVIAEASGLSRLPQGLGFEQAAPLLCAGHVALSAFLRGTPQQGERVAVLGLGGLGHLAVQIAAAHGHEVIALTGTRDKQDDARSFGASEALLAASEPGRLLEQVGGADLIISTTNNLEHASDMVRGLRLGGRLVLVGLGQGNLTFDPMELLQREASIIGALQGPRRELEQVLALAAEGAVVPRVESYPLHLCNRALGRLRRGSTRYRAVVSFR